MNIKMLLKTIVSCLLLGFIFLHVDWTKILSILSGANVSLVGLTIFFNVIGVFISVVKWRCLLSVHKINETLARLHSIYYIGFFFNNFLPSMIGGDFIRVLKTSGKEKQYTKAFSAILTERATGLAAMLLLAGIAALWNMHRNLLVGINWLVIFGAGLAGVSVLVWGLGIFLNYDKVTALGNFKGFTIILRLKNAITGYLQYPGMLVKVFTLSLLFHFLLISNGYLFAKSIGLDVDFVLLGVIFPVTMMMAMIPVSLNGFGIKEGSLIILLGQVGVAQEEALIIAFLSRLFVILASIAGGALYMFEDPSMSVSSMSKVNLSELNS